MKFLQIFIPVAILHVVVVVVLLFQPGCQSRRTPPPPPPGASSAAVKPPAATPTTPIRSTPSSSSSISGRQAPMRPVGSGQSSDFLDPAFNANLAVADENGVLRPLDSGSSSRPSGGGSSPTLVEPEMDVYTIAPGDSLSRIARRVGITVAELKSANGLTNDMIRVGDTLMVPSASSAPRSTVVEIDSAGSTVYTVKPGDNLSVIARRNGVSVGELKAANGLRSDTIRVGQELYIPTVAGGYSPPPPAATRSSAVTTPSGSTYTVKSGDTPIVIARRLGVSVQDLLRANGNPDPTRLLVGQVLIVPAGGSAVAPPPAARPVAPAPRPAAEPVLRTAPTRPAPLNPDDLEASLDDVPISEAVPVTPSN